MVPLDTYSIWVVISFVLGYILITIEHLIKINKATTALFMAIFCWLFIFIDGKHIHHESMEVLLEQLSNASQVVFFLIGALTIVELISTHKGFKIIADALRINSKRQLLWTAGFITFFLSAILDNLTTTIVMITLVSKMFDNREDRWLVGGGIVIAANAGGAWTPIGDITTTMLWIGGQLTTLPIIAKLFVPSLVCMVVSFAFLHFMLKGNLHKTEQVKESKKEHEIEPKGRLIFFLGIGCLLFVPIFKILTGMPPFMGILLGLAFLWLVTDLLHSHDKNREHLTVPSVITKVDFSGILFFLGILMAVGALEASGLLKNISFWLDANIGDTTIIAGFIGLISAVIDNVPLVAAAMGMYPLTQYPTDSTFWKLVAYCAGTGGSILIIGSAAGVVFMGLERVDFIWYLKRISLPALIGYLAGMGTFLLMIA
jgi:NhaD family Na+/H+ antiporter